MKLRLYFILPFLLQATLWRVLMRPLFYMFAGFKVYGLENLKNLPRGVIFALNHSSELDPVLLPLALPVWSRFCPMFYIVREPKFYTDPIFSWRRHFYDLIPFKALGAYAIVSGVRDYTLTLKKHIRILGDGGSVCIFPEGGFSKDGTIGKAHGGVGFMAFASGKPVVPVLIEGVGNHASTKGISFTFLPAQKFEINNPNVIDFQAFGESVLTSIRSARAQHIIQLKQGAGDLWSRAKDT